MVPSIEKPEGSAVNIWSRTAKMDGNGGFVVAVLSKTSIPDGVRLKSVPKISMSLPPGC